MKRLCRGAIIKSLHRIHTGKGYMIANPAGFYSYKFKETAVSAESRNQNRGQDTVKH